MKIKWIPERKWSQVRQNKLGLYARKHDTQFSEGFIVDYGQKNKKLSRIALKEIEFFAVYVSAIVTCGNFRVGVGHDRFMKS
ncbi:MAG: hypothetical protein EXS25_12545 [Pedosphaera sp.]|nr:hypothetical protein [Pedosphaera sp.]